MIIPKAIFLHRKYQFYQQGTHHSVKSECILAACRLVNQLRNPEVHKLGAVSLFFAINNFPLLCKKEDADKNFAEIKKQFETAGYQIQITHSLDGFFILLEWRNVSPYLE